MHYACNDTAVSAVRSDQCDQDLDAQDQAKHKDSPYAVAQCLMLRLVSERLGNPAAHFGHRLPRGLGLGGPPREAFHLKLPESTAHPQDDVLPDAERADDGTIDSATDERQQHQRDDHRHVEGKAGGKELEFCHPAPPLLSYTDEKERDADKEDGSERDSDFLQHCLSVLKVKIIQISQKWKPSPAINELPISFPARKNAALNSKPPILNPMPDEAYDGIMLSPP